MTLLPRRSRNLGYGDLATGSEALGGGVCKIGKQAARGLGVDRSTTWNGRARSSWLGLSGGFSEKCSRRGEGGGVHSPFSIRANVNDEGNGQNRAANNAWGKTKGGDYKPSRWEFECVALSTFFFYACNYTRNQLLGTKPYRIQHGERRPLGTAFYKRGIIQQPNG